MKKTANGQKSMKRLLKEAIKQDIIGFLFVCFIVGAGFIWLSSGYGLLEISDGEKINATVLWLTALAIFWYAYETYQLKQNTADQVGIQEVMMQNEFLPILEPISANSASATLRVGRFSNFQLRNLGRGPAKYVDLYVGNIKVPMDWSLAAGESILIVLPVEGRIKVEEMLKTASDTVKVKVTYQDIYKRKFYTEHIVFEKDAGIYKLRQGSWGFKQAGA